MKITLKDFTTLTPHSVQTYRSKLRQLWLKEQAGMATDGEVALRKQIERQLGVEAWTIPGQGRPRKNEAVFAGDPA